MTLQRDLREFWRWVVLPMVALSTSVVLAGAQVLEATRDAAVLSLDVAISIRSHNGGAPVHFSPDGEWIAHTVMTSTTVSRGRNSLFSETGTPLSWGDRRMEATLTRASGDSTLRLGGRDASSWSPSWSPAGDRVAFYSDDGGEAGLWIWERSTRIARRVADVIVRPAWGVEIPQWSARGDRVLVKVIPAGLSLAEANARGVLDTALQSVRSSVRAPSVVVRRSPPEPASATPPNTDTASVANPAAALSDRLATQRADLAVIDVATGRADRVVSDALVFSYAFSPDDGSVAYSMLIGAHPTTQQGLFDLRVVGLHTRADSVVAAGLALATGNAWSWSPDGHWIAYATADNDDPAGLAVLSGTLGIVALNGDDPPTITGIPPATDSEARAVPLWSQDGSALYRVASGELWSVAPRTGITRRVARLDGVRVRSIATPSRARAVSVALDTADVLFVIASDTTGTRSSLYSIEPRSGLARPRIIDERRYVGGLSFAFSQSTGAVVFVTRERDRLDELWVYEGSGSRARQASMINPAQLTANVGESRRISWTRQDGRELSGALLLPTGYRTGTRVPLVTWVYGGANSASPNWFSLVGSGAMFNMHILATRGFAVFFPDVPYRTGQLTDDLVASVLSGIDAVVEQGVADPERLAVMGQSFGSLNVLQLLTRTSRFKAAVISAAVLHPDLFADYLTDVRYYERGQGNQGGSIWEYPERFRANSPLFGFPQITTPVLILQGAADRDLRPSSAIFTALERLGKHVELRIYPGQGHVIMGPAHVRDAWERRIEFLTEHLGLQRPPSR